MSSYTFVHQHQGRVTWDPVPPRRPTDPPPPPTSPGNRRWNWLQSYISLAGWGVYYYGTARDWQKGESNWGKDGRAVGAMLGGEELRLAGEEERREEFQEGGRKRRRWEEKSWVMCGAEGEDWDMAAKESVCVLSLHVHVCVCVCPSVDTTNKRWGKDNEKLMKREGVRTEINVGWCWFGRVPSLSPQFAHPPPLCLPPPLNPPTPPPSRPHSVVD